MSRFTELACPNCNRELLYGSFEGRELGRLICPDCKHEFEAEEAGLAQQDGKHGVVATND
jgi:hypothetical protein